MDTVTSDNLSDKIISDQNRRGHKQSAEDKKNTNEQNI